MMQYRGSGSAGGLGVAGGGPMDMGEEEGAPDAVYTLSKSLDPRIVPTKQRYAAPIGAQALTSVNVQLTQLNNTSHTFPVTPPSPGVVIQSNIMYDLTAYVPFTASHVTGMSFGTMWPRYGVDFAIASSNPVNRMVTNWQVTINNQTVQFQNIANQDLVYLGERFSTRPARACNYRTPMYTSWDDAYGTTYGLGDSSDLQGDGDVPPGSYPIQWALPPNVYCYYVTAGAGPAPVFTQLNPPTIGTGPNGQYTLLSDLVAKAPANALAVLYDVAAVPAGGPASAAAVGVSLGTATGYPANQTPAQWNTTYPGATDCQSNIIPAGLPYIWNPANAAASPYAIVTRIQDPMQCPPFAYATETAFSSQGMWGVNNALIIAQLSNPYAARWLQGTTKGGMTSLVMDGANWKTLQAQLWLQYLTPPQTPQTLLPSRCVMPMLYKQYTICQPTLSTPIAPGTLATINLPAYTFSTVSNYLLISVRPVSVTGQQDGSVPFNECDYCLAFPDSPFTQFQYSNMSGLMSNMSRQQLIGICRQNGVQASVTQFGGLGDISPQSTGYINKAGMRTGAGGAVLLLRPGIDFPLPLGITAGTSGMVQIQFSIQVINQGHRPVNVQVTTTSLSTAYFVNDNGAAKQLLVGLDEEQLLKAPFGAETMSAHTLVGAGLWDTVKNIGSKLWEHRNLIKNIARTGASAMGFQLPDIDLGGRGMAGGGVGGKRNRLESSRGSLLADLASS